ncbi:MAG: glycyl-radical enzyme activating protein [Clostridia bacterium]|nr:glycyl-radical enzyme activating protein [Clostridia bacterium]
MNMGIVFNIQKFCIHDGDGIRTCVFLKGCPLRCIWCHNPEGLHTEPVLSFDRRKCSLCGRCLAACAARRIENGVLAIDRKKCVLCGKCTEICLNDANELIGKEMTASQVMAEVMKDKIFYETSGGGLTVTGGEPSCQAAFSLELLTLAKDAGISSAIETCGIGARDFYEKAADLGASFLYDVKCINPVRHRILTGADNAQILSNLCYLMDRGMDLIIRLPMIPGCNDSDADIAALAAFLQEHKCRYRYAQIMPYHALGTGKSEKLGVSAAFVHDNATDAEKNRWQSLFASYGIDVKVSQ